MDISFGIRVVDMDGYEQESIKVDVLYPYTNDNDYTDEDGWVHFEKDTLQWQGIRADIYVDGSQVADQIWIEDGDTFSYTI